MASVSIKPAQPSRAPVAQAAMAQAALARALAAQTATSKGDWREFLGHLARKQAVTGDLLRNFADQAAHEKKKMRDLWELTDLSANDFADEIASFYQLTRLDLPILLGAASLAAGLSQRFLREASVFPCRLSDNELTLVVADPTDETAIHATELALGSPVI